jgi:hypothetical protein
MRVKPFLVGGGGQRQSEADWCKRCLDKVSYTRSKNQRQSSAGFDRQGLFDGAAVSAGAAFSHDLRDPSKPRPCGMPYNDDFV